MTPAERVKQDYGYPLPGVHPARQAKFAADILTVVRLREALIACGMHDVGPVQFTVACRCGSYYIPGPLPWCDACQAAERRTKRP